MEAISQYIFEEINQDFEQNICDIIFTYKEEMDFRNLLDNHDSRYVLKNEKIPESVLETFIDEIDMRYLSKYQKLSENFIRKNKDRLDWYWISIKQSHLTEKFIIEMENYIDWSSVYSFFDLTKEFVKENKFRVNWREVSDMKESVLGHCLRDEEIRQIIFTNDTFNEIIAEHVEDGLSIDFIREFKDIFNKKWYYISQMPTLIGHEEEFKEYIYWKSYISSNLEKLPLDFLRKHINDLNINYLVTDEDLKEEFIEEFQDMIDWPSVYRNQHYLSEEFLMKHATKVSMKDFLSNIGIPKEVIRLFKDHLDWKTLSTFRVLNEDKDFYYEFKDYIQVKHIQEEVITLEMVDNCEDKTFLYNYLYLHFYYPNVNPTEEFKKIMKKYPEHINWSLITKFYILDEDFMRDMQDYIDWGILKTRWLSGNFRKEFAHKLG